MKHSYYGQLDRLDHSKGGIKETHTVKNKDALLQIDLTQHEWPYWRDKVHTLLWALTNGKIRTITIIDKNGSNV